MRNTSKSMRFRKQSRDRRFSRNAILHGFIAAAPNSSQLCRVYPWEHGAFGTVVTNPVSLPAGSSFGTGFSPNKDFVVIGGSTAGNNLKVYPWSSGFGTPVADPAVFPNGFPANFKWSPDQNYLGMSSNSSPFINVYNWSGAFGTKVADPGILPTGSPGANGCGFDWSPDGAYVAVAHVTTPFVSVYPFDGTFGTKVADPVTLPTGNAVGVRWSPDGRYIAVCHTNSPFVSVYEWDNGFGDKLNNAPSVTALTFAETFQLKSVNWSPDGRYIGFTGFNTPFVYVIKWNNGFAVDMGPPATLPGTSGGNGANFMTWSEDGNFVIVLSTGTPFIQVYEWNNGFGTKVPDPLSLPNASSRGGGIVNI